LAEHLELGWQFLKAAPYTHGFTRKAFRAPDHPRATLSKRRTWLTALLGLAGKYRTDVISISWLASWAPHLGEAWRNPLNEIGQLLAAVIDAGGPPAAEVFDVLTESMRNEHEIGGPGAHINRALMLCSRPNAWELMEKTLIAAQRQEGLRQAILETIDESHPQAFRRMLRLIRENDLARFSAVTRAVDVWFGLGWDSASVGKVNAAIDRALLFLDDENARQSALEGKEAEDAYFALWAIAFENAPASIAEAARLLQHAKVEHRYIAAVHLAQLGLPDAETARVVGLDDSDLRVAWRTLSGLAVAERDKPELFGRLERLFERTPAKPSNSKAIVWPWTAMRLDRRAITGQMLTALGDLPPTRLLPYLSAFQPYHRKVVVDLLAQQKKWDGLTRASLLDLAGDAGSAVRTASYAALATKPLERGEAERLEGYLNRTASDLRRGVVGLLAKQADAAALASTDRLLAAKHALQRLAGLELLRHLAEADRQRKQCQKRAEEYRTSRKETSKEEETQFAAILQSGREHFTLDNALGLMNPAERSPVVQPKMRDVPFITDAAIACLKDLDELVHTHRETIVSYEINGKSFEQLLGNFTYGFPSPIRRGKSNASGMPFPLRELWENWRAGRDQKLCDSDGLELLRARYWGSMHDYHWRGSWQPWMKRSPEHRQIASILSDRHDWVKLRYQGVVCGVLEWLVHLHPVADTVSRLLDAVESAFARVPERIHGRLVELAATAETESERENGEPDWRAHGPLSFWDGVLQSVINHGGHVPTPEEWTRYWLLMRWRDEPVPGARRERCDLNVLWNAYAAGGATRADWYDHLLGPRHPTRYHGVSFTELKSMTSPRNLKKVEAYCDRFPEVRELLDACRERILEIELGRGEEATAATVPALHLQSLYGIDTLLRVLSALGKQPFKIESTWNRDRQVGRAATLTRLIGVTYPKPEDSPADFVAKLKEAVVGKRFPEERVLELAFHAPQWSRFIEAYLGWPGFSEGLYWFLAHMKYIGDTGENATIGAGVASEEKDSEQAGNQVSTWDRFIGERTALTANERQEGAVDVEWFQRVYAQLTGKRWQAMAQAARYAATPAQAKRATFIADVLLGKASRRDLIAGIRKKFLKENVRLLGLLPLAAGAKRTADIAERYRVLQEYRRYAKQLSAMTKEGALRAGEIGMENLARIAGYRDPLRLEWAMEADSVKDLASGPVSVKHDNITVTLELDDRARPQLSVSRNGKELKSIPTEIKKKDKRIAALAERATELKRQSSRTRESLELAMCRGDSFTAAELLQLCQHGLLAPILSRLVLIGDGILGYPDKGGKALRDEHGKLEPIKKTETLRIAHPYDLLATKKWDAWQHECFQAERVQPFKQVFRELYVVTEQEKSDGILSRRYAGQQVNPTQAMALWGQRGWNVREGVWKTYYDVGITAFVGFNNGAATPLEVEGLTIESVQFQKRDATEWMKLIDVPPRVFSEVMRDLDLVVSVAHRGGVDPEASASTVEMRGKLLRETCQLLKLDNVRFKGNYALVDGELGKYSIHLGSAVVHKLPGGALCIVPVHAQHRGRLFLPFADDDPKTAEVITKALLLARDRDIQDPVILDQLRHAGV
jgi:hypothetical protein